jgi:hypothetical protein
MRPRGVGRITGNLNFEIGRILHLKSEIRDIRLDRLKSVHLVGSPAPVQLEISDFGFEMQDSSNFEILQSSHNNRWAT